jgi:hypothetical protein
MRREVIARQHLNVEKLTRYSIGLTEQCRLRVEGNLQGATSVV